MICKSKRAELSEKRKKIVSVLTHEQGSCIIEKKKKKATKLFEAKLCILRNAVDVASIVSVPSFGLSMQATWLNTVAFDPAGSPVLGTKDADASKNLYPHQKHKAPTVRKRHRAARTKRKQKPALTFTVKSSYPLNDSTARHVTPTNWNLF